MRSITFAFIIAAGFIFAPSVQAQSDSLLKTNDIRIMLNLMDVGAAMQQSLIAEIATGRANNETGLPPQFWDEFEKEALTSVPAFIERLIPTYDKQFTHAEIKSLIEIYKNPVMKKFNDLDQVLSESAEKAGEAWGEEIGLRVAMKLDNVEPEEAAPASNVSDTKPAKKKK
jgi:uncharacterized protein